MVWKYNLSSCFFHFFSSLPSFLNALANVDLFPAYCCHRHYPNLSHRQVIAVRAFLSGLEIPDGLADPCVNSAAFWKTMGGFEIFTCFFKKMVVGGFSYMDLFLKEWFFRWFQHKGDVPLCLYVYCRYYIATTLCSVISCYSMECNVVHVTCFIESY